MSVYTKKLADTAMKEFEKFHLIRVQEEPLASRIKEYWKGIAAFPGVSTPWSAVFVSWCVRQAGAVKSEFAFAAAHAKFVFAAIKNTTNETGVFRGHDVADHAPKVGDILHKNRAGNHFDFAFAKSHDGYLSHSAIVIEVATDTKGHYLRTIGGNEADSVGMKEVRLDANGIVKNPNGLFISVIETLK